MIDLTTITLNPIPLDVMGLSTINNRLNRNLTTATWIIIIGGVALMSYCVFLNHKIKIIENEKQI